MCKFQNWSLANRLSINYSKTCYLLITNRNIQLEPILYHNRSILDRKNSIKFLGVIIDAPLKFDLHVNYICKKISKSIGILYKLKDFLPIASLKALYYSFIYPYLLYGIIIWGGTYQAHLHPLIILQKRSVRLISNASYLAHSEPLFLSNRILKFNDVFIFEIAKFIFRSQYNINFHRNHTYTTRNRDLLLPAFQRLSNTQKSVYCKGIHIWNSLP